MAMKNGNKGFTLIELIVVISIIALLVGIIGPSISKVRELGFKAKSTAAIQELASGAMQYKSEYNYYPLQTPYPSSFSSKASAAFGAYMLGYDVTNAANTAFISPDDHTIATSLQHDRKPIISESNDRFSTGGSGSLAEYTPLDQWKKGDELAVLYYPSNIGNDGTTFNSVFTDDINSDYGATLPVTSDHDKFNLRDTKFGTGSDSRIFNADSFLLIAPGIDRAYFTGDDIKNF